MGLFDMVSQRFRTAKREAPDVYQYEILPEPLRVKICLIAQATLGRYNEALPYSQASSGESWDEIARTLRKVRGVFTLHDANKTSEEEVLRYFLSEKSTVLALDVVQELFQHIQHESARQPDWHRIQRHRQDPKDAIAELNKWLHEDRVGYQFEQGLIVRVDSRFAHAEVVKPALQVLTDPRFRGPNNEFLEAHEHYRHGRHKECLVSCSKAFESTMKVICETRGWQIEKPGTALKLIDTCLNNGLLPKFLDNQLASVRKALESGVPTVRNKYGGHGQGSEVVEVQPHFASYALHLTAANILLLVEAEKNLPR